jgi:uncharacterized protein (TIGR02246 family)
MGRLIRISSVVTLLAMLPSGVLSGQEPTNAEVRRLSEAYAQAWAKGDAKALTGLHTNEALRIGPDGKVVAGRAAIEQALTEALTGPYRGTKIGMTPGQITRVSQDVYAAEGTFLVSGGMPPAGSPTRGRYLNTIVRVNGRWLIASHATIPPPPPPK